MKAITARHEGETIQITIRLPLDLLEDLNKFAALEGRARANLIYLILKEFRDDKLRLESTRGA